MIVYYIDREDIDCLDSMTEDEIGQYVEFIDIINEIIEENEDINKYWKNLIEIKINKIVVILNIIKFWDLNDLIKENNWLKFFLSW